MIKKALSDECHKHNTKVEKTTNDVEKMTQCFFDPSQMEKKLNKNIKEI